MSATLTAEETLKLVGEIFVYHMPFNRALGLELERYEKDFAQLSFNNQPMMVGNWAQSILHGGVIASALDVAAGLVCVGSTLTRHDTINEDERTEFTRHINAVLAGDADLGNRLPFPTDTFEMFDDCKDGLVLAKLINDSVPDTIDERVLNLPGKKTKNLNAFQMSENNNIVIESAKGIGCSVVNIGAGDIIEVREHLILGLIWQIIRRGLLGKIDIKLHPELYRLLDEDETLEQFLRLPPEQILLRWFNYHLKAANWPRRFVTSLPFSLSRPVR